MKLNRSYSLLEIRAVDDEKRIIEGIATTPSVARDGDIIETEGVIFKLPIPFLLRHKQEFPLGNVISASAGTDGIHVRIQIASAGVAEHIDEAWRMIKAGVIRGLSLGWRTLEEKFDKVINGFRITKSEWLELSAVPVPADMNATITSVRSIDTEFLAASGNTDSRSSVVRLNLPGVSGLTSSKHKGKSMTIKEQIASFEAKRSASDARMNALMDKSSDEGRTLDETEKEEYDTLEREVGSIDDHLVRLRAREKTLLTTATAITATTTSDPVRASEARGGTVVQVRSNIPQGIRFARYVMALAACRGNRWEAAAQAKHFYPDQPEIEMVLRTAVEPGTTTGTTWAAPLVPAAQSMFGEFIELLRPATIIGRIPGLRKVPFNVKLPAQSGGGTYGWVGENQAKPVSALAFTEVELRWAKVAGIIVLTKELVKFSNPSAEAIVRDDMVKGTSQFLDAQFIDPTVAANGNISPASITNGVTPTAASNTTAAAFRTDMKALFGTFLTVNDDPSDTVILMSATVALNLSLLMNALGQPEFPNIGMQGGTILGLPVIVSQAVGARIILVKASDILMADDGGVEIDMSQEASLVMDTNPQASPATTELVSLFQRNLLALRVEVFRTWKKARTTSVAYISNAAYGG